MLTGKQRALLDALQKQNAALAEMYQGALVILSQPNHPDRLAFAAHGIRELADKLPDHLDLPTDNERLPLRPASLKPKVADLLVEWRKVCQASCCSTADGWQGTIDKSLQRFLKRIGDFALWFDREMPNVLEQAARLIDALDPLANMLPSNIRSLRAAEFKEYQDYFTRVSHHSTTTSDEFDKHLSSFEHFIIDKLRPSTFDDFNDIDEFLMEVDDD